jgi:hypothetical protein
MSSVESIGRDASHFPVQTPWCFPPYLTLIIFLQIFRLVMYPNYGSTGGGLLRLHSTYRHDFKIYSSDEGRVQVRVFVCVL